MAQHTITIAASPLAGDAESRWQRQIASAWPRYGHAPAFRSISLETLSVELAREDPEGFPHQRGAYLIVLGPEMPGAGLLQLADKLQQRLVPTVMLLPVVDAHARGL